MEVIVSAVFRDIISRSVSFFVERYRRQQTGGAEGSLQRLRLLLLRVQAIVQEAERRDITNQAMLRQLETLRRGMYRGYFVLDTFTCKGHGEGDATAKDEVSDDSFALCRFNPAKRLCLSIRTPKSMLFGGKGHNELREVLSSLEMTVADGGVCVVLGLLSSGVPRTLQQLLGLRHGHVFGGHTEYERIVSFLLQFGLPGTRNLSVLPIVGPVRVGKSTLVEHVCYDERARGFFSSTVFFSGDDLEGTNALQDSGVIKYRNGASHGRLLVILELIGDLEEEIWRRLFSLVSHMAHGSKVIVTSSSRSKRIVQFGTTHALELNVLPQEAYWYYFKSIALRSTGPKDYQELSSIAMDTAAELGAVDILG